ncbi:hypothetical protein NT6N_32970 [Oceaniferula spumae]|uniref:Uncharacterized protein n=1 Tax=Oceaniferula spumae TaxID=2979115 RepID=A0AAT9FQ30_9BACT
MSLIIVGITASLSMPQAVQAQAKADNEAQNVRIMRNEDGSFTEFRKSADDRVIERRTYGDRNGGNGDRVLRMTIIYRKDKHGKLRSGKIHDGTGKVLYRVVYGYHKTNGKLVAEDMFDARMKRGETITDPKTNQAVFKEKPVRCLRHRYDAQGRQLKPIVVCAPAGLMAEKLFGKYGSSHYGSDPWNKENSGGTTVNPNSKPLK